jgi:hypothetical protein
MNIFKTWWMPIIGLILSITPIWGYIVVSYELIPSVLCNASILILTLMGIIVGFLTLIRSQPSDQRTIGGRITKIGFYIGIFAFVGYGIFIPSAIAMRNRERNHQVKHIINSLRGCIKEFKQTHKGLPPQSIKDLEPTIPDSLLRIQNPYKPHQKYTIGSRGLIDGIPNNFGIIGYIAPTNPNEPYKFIFLEKGDWDKPIPYFIDENNVVGVLKINR